MNNLEYILDFTVNLGCKMMAVGANLERVEDTMYRVCRSYHLCDVSIFSLSSIIIISAKSPDNFSGTRQINVPPSSNHLEKLNRFNQLSRQVCAQTPPPDTLAELLADAETVKDYSLAAILAGYIIAMSSLTVIYNGTISDLMCANINTMILYFLMEYLDRRGLNSIVVNTVSMWVAGSLALFYIKFGIGENAFIIMIVNAMMAIPGTKLVNAVRNVLCGNEMNGILEFLKVVLESLAIVLGLILSIYMFGGKIPW
ncbi:MAG: threonine/serine exporter family protein [Eubacterium sp.]|nr:threonine/serine exporter family protein [Eubacterium sp.]